MKQEREPTREAAQTNVTMVNWNDFRHTNEKKIATTTQKSQEIMGTLRRNGTICALCAEILQLIV